MAKPCWLRDLSYPETHQFLSTTSSPKCLRLETLPVDQLRHHIRQGNHHGLLKKSAPVAGAGWGRTLSAKSGNQKNKVGGIPLK